MKLTKEQRQVVDLYDKFKKKHGHYPTLRYAQDKLGWGNVSLVLYHIRRAEAKGYLADRRKNTMGG